MQSIVSKGKNVDEAVNLGLRIMDIQKHKVNIEIVKQGKERFWKVLSKEAVVKLTRSVERKHIRPLESLVDDVFFADEEKNITLDKKECIEEVAIEKLQGKVWVQDGKINCEISQDNYPTVEIPKHLTLLINGRDSTKKKLILSEKETYGLRSEVVEEEMEWRITMDTQKNTALLRVEPGYKMDYTVLDAEPAQHIKLSVVENKEIRNTLQFKEVIEKMSLLRIKNGVNHSEIIKATEATQSSVFVIAEGKQAIDGKNGWLELNVDTKIQVGLKENENGRVDFREIKSIPDVDEGKVIGIIHPPVPGRIGYTVTNDPIFPKEIYPLIVRAGNGVTLIEDKIIATESGRPQIEQRGLMAKVSIIKKLTHTGNVDLSSGNITFKGDVEILGEVAGHMSVEAMGYVLVHKTVNNAEVRSTRGVTLQSNSIGSKIIAGKSNHPYSKLVSDLARMIETVEEIMKSLERVTNSDTFKNSEYKLESVQPILRMLIEKRFKGFPQVIKDFRNSIKEKNASLGDDTWTTIGTSLEKLFMSLSAKKITTGDLLQLIMDMKNLVMKGSERSNKGAFITLENAMNSNLSSSGPISVTGQGCMNTEIHSGGHVHINGILRGGVVYGARGVTIGEAGSKSTSSTIVAVPHDQSIRIDKSLEGVILKVGQDVYKFTETAYRVHARINKEDKLIVHSSNNERSSKMK